MVPEGSNISRGRGGSNFFRGGGGGGGVQLPIPNRNPYNVIFQGRSGLSRGGGGGGGGSGTPVSPSGFALASWYKITNHFNSRRQICDIISLAIKA